MEKVYQQNWIDLPQETRNHLVKVFDIPRTGITEVRDQTVVSDGHTNTDLQAITADKMSAYIGQPVDTLDFGRLWTITLSKVKSDLHPPVFYIQPDGVVTDVLPPIEPVKKYCETCASTAGRHFKGCPRFK